MENFQVSNLLDMLSHEVSLALIAIMLLSFLFGMLFGLVSRGRRLRQLKREIKLQAETIEELKKKVEELTEEVDLKEADLQKARFEIDDLRAKMQRIENENNQLSAEMNTAKDTISKLRNTNQTYADTIEGMTQEVNELKAQNSQLSTHVTQGEEALSNIAVMQSMYGATQQKLSELEQKINRLEIENDGLKSQIGSAVVTSTSSSPAETAIDDIAPDSFDDRAFQTTRDSAKAGERLISTRSEKDDLTLINGIGPFIEQKLNEAGVHTYDEISRWDNTTIAQITKQIQFFPGRIEDDNWVEQAARLSQMKLDNPEAFSRQGGTPSNPKDLKIIEGIGAKIEELLRTKGIRTWVELAGTDVETLRNTLREAGTGFNSIDPTSWPEQARLAANGEWEKLRQYQNYLGKGKS